jgi:hypothetical protein
LAAEIFGMEEVIVGFDDALLLVDTGYFGIFKSLDDSLPLMLFILLFFFPKILHKS